MPRAKDTQPKTASAATDRDATVRGKARTSTTLTHERIADDLAAFRKAGGKIEVLGVTRLLTRIDATPSVSLPAAATVGKRRR